MNPATTSKPVRDGSALWQLALDGCARLEWCLDVGITPGARSFVCQELFRNLFAGDAYPAQFLEWLAQSMEQMRNQADSSARFMWRESERPRIADSIRTSQRAWAKPLLDVYDLGDVVLAGGQPPLTARNARAFIELTNFKIAVSFGLPPDPPGSQLSEHVLRQTIESYNSLPAESREQINNAPATLAWLREQWPQFPPVQREALRNAWAGEIQSACEPSPSPPFQAAGTTPIHPVAPRPAEDAAPQTESCEIVITTVSIPIYIGAIPLYSTSLGFQAETRSSGEPVVVASVDQTDIISQEEMASGAVQETPERKALVDQLARNLEADGWKSCGRGQAWFNLRFHRSAVEQNHAEKWDLHKGAQIQHLMDLHWRYGR